MTEATPTEQPSVNNALGRSVLYSALTVSLSRPEESRLARVFGGAASEVFVNAVRVVDRLGVEEEPTASPLEPVVVELIRACEQATMDELDQAYQRLFGHTARGKVPPYETEYGREALFRQSQDLADINGFYTAFGLTLSSSTHERIDHVGAECEFMSFLACKEARMLTAGDRGGRDQVLEAERLFLRDHLGQFGRAFARSLTKEADHPFYQLAGEFCFGLLTRDCRTLGVPPGSEFVLLRSTSEMDVPMACSSDCGLLRSGPSPGGPQS